ncbi:MAG: spondin domain-containing protein [Ferruginibacter sp.]
MKRSMCLAALCALVLTACHKDDMPPVAASGKFTVTIENVSPQKSFLSSGVFNTPVGAAAPGAIKPGDKYEFMVTSGRNQRLSFATMLAATNDIFFAPDEKGIALYDNSGKPLTGEITDQVYLWDAGTEVNEEPAVGPNTVTKQAGPNTGPAENGSVRKLSMVSDGFTYPQVAEVIKVNVAYVSGQQFKITIENVSTSSTLQTSEGPKPAPASPGVWVIHSGMSPLFTPGMPDRGQGIEAIAEDGNPAGLGTYTSANSGLTYPISPGAWAVHKTGDKPIFTNNMEDYGEGVEAIAEDGDNAALNASLALKTMLVEKGMLSIPVDSTKAGPLHPGEKYQFTFTASDGDRLSFVNMLAATNDVFIGPADEGIMLFSSGKPVTGDVSSQIQFWDAGTEINEAPFYGPNTVTNQPAKNTGPAENGVVKLLSLANDGYTYPAVSNVIKVTIENK